MNHSNSVSKLKYVMILIFLGFTSLMMSYDNTSHGLWIPKSPQELLESSDIIFVGNITSVNVLQIEKQSSYTTEENGTDKNFVENYTINLDEYKVAVEEFLKNPQNSSKITVRQPTIPSIARVAAFDGFKAGDRVLFYVKTLDGINEYSPESFLIPKPCMGKDVLAQKRIERGGEFFTIQNGNKVDYGNFTANKPVQFVYDKDVGILSGKSFDVLVSMTKTVGQNTEIVFTKEIHAESKPCEWIASTEWEITPQEGDYGMDIRIKEGDSIFNPSDTGFSVKSDMATHNFMSPLKQFKHGITLTDITCAQGLQLILKAEGNLPACVSPYTAQRLMKIGWAENLDLSPNKLVFAHSSSSTVYSGGGSVIALDGPPVNLPKTFFLSHIGNYSGEQGPIIVSSHVFAAKLYRGNMISYDFNATAPITFSLWFDNRTSLALYNVFPSGGEKENIFTKTNVTSFADKLSVQKTGVYTFQFSVFSPKPIATVTFDATRQ